MINVVEEVVEEEEQVISIALDHSTLKGDPSAGDTRYTIALTGPIDDRWVTTYLATQAESTGYRRFRLDRETGTVSFTCRTVDGPAHVIDVLERLEAFLALVNRQVMANRRIEGGELTI
jgi:hypothetical protein